MTNLLHLTRDAESAVDALLNQLVALNALAKNDPAFANIVTVINRLTEK